MASQPKPKVPRLSCSDDASAATSQDDVFERFSMADDTAEVLREALTTLLGKTSAIGSLTIRHCNAAYGAKYGNLGRSFPRADVDLISNTEPGDSVYSFRTIFYRGISLIDSYLKTKVPPAQPELKFIVAKLLTYLLDKDEQKKVTTVKRSKGKEKLCECEMAVVFAQHYFTRLTTSSSFTLDQYYLNKFKRICCSCGCETNIGRNFGDTSLGCPDTWHGHLDILLDSNLPVSVVDNDKRSDSASGRSPPSIEMRIKENIEQPVNTTSQLVAQAIVFSFSQKKNHPELKHCLIPAVGISRERIIFYFYDSEHDVLLKSPSFPVFEGDEVSLLSVLASWMVVNYKLLCNGLSETMLQKVKKANFSQQAGNLLPVYQNDLTLGGLSRELCSVYPMYRPEYLVKCKFFEDLEDFEDESI